MSVFPYLEEVSKIKKRARGQKKQELFLYLIPKQDRELLKALDKDADERSEPLDIYRAHVKADKR